LKLEAQIYEESHNIEEHDRYRNEMRSLGPEDTHVTPIEASQSVLEESSNNPTETFLHSNSP
jgi:hypothetical protein